MIKAVPKGNNERLNWIRNDGDEEAAVDLSDTKLVRILRLST